MPLFWYIYFLFTNTHSYNNSLITFAEAHLHIFTLAGKVGETFMGCRAEIRTWASLTASLRTII
jgi:hypothetical protein